MSIGGGDGPLVDEDRVDEENDRRTRSWVLGIITTWLVGGILTARDQVTAYMLDVQGAIIFALESGGGALAGAVATVGTAPLLVLDALEASLVTVAASAGPFAPLVVAVGWAFAAFATLALLRFVWWVIPLVIPWL